MLKELENLLLLQSLDIQIKEIEDILHRIPQEITKLEKQQEEKEKQLENIKDDLEDQSKLQRKLEADLQDNEEKLIKLNVQLNQLKSNTEYRTMLKQIETIKYQNREIENAILETFEDIDARKIEKTKFRKELEKFKVSIKESISEKEKTLNENQEQLAALQEEAEQTRSELKKDIISHYDNLTHSNFTPAIAPIVEKCCGGCHLALRPIVLIEIRPNDKINYCENCFRFLYWKS